MSLKTFVKVSNITNLSDARYCAGMMVDILGFNLDTNSTGFIGIKDFKEIANWVSGVKFCGEFETADKDNICEVLKDCDLDYIQIEDMSSVESIHLLGKPIIFKNKINTIEDVHKLSSDLTYLDELIDKMIINCDDTSLFEEIDRFIAFFNGNPKLLKGFGVSNNQTLGKFPGIELEATDEERPGYKDYGQVMDVLELLEEED